MALTKKQMNERINKQLGYELIPAYEMFTVNELKDIYKLVVKENKTPVLINNEYVFVDNIEF